jgi:hypothetical protein
MSPCNLCLRGANNGHVFLFYGDRITPRPRLCGVHPPVELVPPRSSATCDSDSDSDEEPETTTGGPSQSRPMRGQTIMRWSGLPSAKRDFQDGLVGDPIDWAHGSLSAASFLCDRPTSAARSRTPSRRWLPNQGARSGEPREQPVARPRSVSSLAALFRSSSSSSTLGVGGGGNPAQLPSSSSAAPAPTPSASTVANVSLTRSPALRLANRIAADDAERSSSSSTTIASHFGPNRTVPAIRSSQSPEPRRVRPRFVDADASDIHLHPSGFEGLGYGPMFDRSSPGEERDRSDEFLRSRGGGEQRAGMDLVGR